MTFMVLDPKRTFNSFIIVSDKAYLDIRTLFVNDAADCFILSRANQHSAVQLR